MTRQLYSWSGRLLVGLLACAALSGASNNRPPKGEWWYYAGDLASSKYSPLEHINRSIGSADHPAEFVALSLP